MSNHIHLSEIEDAINFFRSKYPSDTSTMSLCWQVRAMAEEYAKLIYFKHTIMPLHELCPKARDAWHEYLSMQAKQAA